MSEVSKARYWINRLDLKPHPEGGHFAEVYRSEEKVPQSGLPDRFPASRSLSTSIYFLLQKGEISAFHRILSDELWYFHDGDPLEIFVIDEQGKLSRHLVGLTDEALPQVVIPHECWFASRTLGEYSLLGCNVAPGFDFQDFVMGTGFHLSRDYPHLKEIIMEFTRQ